MANIDTYHQKYAELSKEEVIKDGDSTSLSVVETEVSKIYDWEQQYYENTKYRSQLPDASRRDIEQEFENAINLFTRVVHLRQSDIATFARQKDELARTIKNYYKALYSAFVQDYRGWKLESQQEEKIEELDRLILSAREKNNQIQQDADTISKREKATAEATQDISLSQLAKYFYQLVQGEHEWSSTQENSNKFRYRLTLMWHKHILGFGRGYRGAARVWLILAFIAFGLTIWFANEQLRPLLQLLNVKDDPSIKTNPNVIYALLIVKALLLAVPIYIIRFCLKNYGSNKHLAADALHKAKALQTLPSYLAIPRNDAAAIREISVAIAQVIFTPPESGFIPNKNDYDGPDIKINSPIK